MENKNKSKCGIYEYDNNFNVGIVKDIKIIRVFQWMNGRHVERKNKT